MVARMIPSFSAPAIVAALWIATTAPARAAEDDVGGGAGGVARQVGMIDMLEVAELFDGDSTGFALRSFEREAVEDRVGRRLLVEIDAVDRVCRLDASQRERCVAAARREVEGCVEAVERLQARHTERSFSLRGDEVERLGGEIATVARRLRFPALGDTLLDRVLEGVLDESQRALWREETARRERLHWQVVVEGTAASIADVFGLSPGHHDELLALLMEKPLRIHERRALALLGDPVSPGLGAIVIARADRARLEGLFDPGTWERIESLLDEHDGLVAEWIAKGVVDE